MFLGLMNLFIFSVSTTLKSYVLILSHNLKNVNYFVQFFYENHSNVLYSVFLTLYKT